MRGKTNRRRYSSVKFKRKKKETLGDETNSVEQKEKEKKALRGFFVCSRLVKMKKCRSKAGWSWRRQRQSRSEKRCVVFQVKFNVDEGKRGNRERSSFIGRSTREKERKNNEIVDRFVRRSNESECCEDKSKNVKLKSDKSRMNIHGVIVDKKLCSFHRIDLKKKENSVWLVSFRRVRFDQWKQQRSTYSWSNENFDETTKQIRWSILFEQKISAGRMLNLFSTIVLRRVLLESRRESRDAPKGADDERFLSLRSSFRRDSAERSKRKVFLQHLITTKHRETSRSNKTNKEQSVSSIENKSWTQLYSELLLFVVVSSRNWRRTSISARGNISTFWMTK